MATYGWLNTAQVNSTFVGDTVDVSEARAPRYIRNRAPGFVVPTSDVQHPTRLS